MAEKIVTIADGYVIPRGWHFDQLLSEGLNQLGVLTLTILIKQDEFPPIGDASIANYIEKRHGGRDAQEHVHLRGYVGPETQEYAGETMTTIQDGLMLSDEDPFEASLMEMVEVRRRKKNDYSAKGNPWSNFDATADHFGLQNYDSAIFNVVQKLARLKELRAPDKLVANEPVYDTYLDTAVYSVLAFAMYREQELERKAAKEEAAAPHATRKSEYPIGHIPAGNDRFA